MKPKREERPEAGENVFFWILGKVKKEREGKQKLLTLPRIISKGRRF